MYMYLALQKHFQTKSKRGFSLGEVLLAGFVLTTGLLSISALMVKSLQNSFENRDTIIAVELAQEGVELVRNVRDNDLAAGNDGFTAFSNLDKHCRINYNDSSSSLDCNSSQGSASRYTLQYSVGFYQHNNTSAERFSRYIYINKVTSGSEINALVRSFVYWGDSLWTPGGMGAVGGRGTGYSGNCTIAKKCVFTEVNLTNWK
jgi:Tfp pilus assembly protein PilV